MAIDDTKAPAEMLTRLNGRITADRESLIAQLRNLAGKLLDSARSLEEDPNRVPSSIGYVAVISTSQTIDVLAVETATLMRLRDEIRRAFRKKEE